MKRYTIILEKAADGSIWARCETDGVAVYGAGKTDEEAVESFKQGVKEVIAYCDEEGKEYPDWYYERMTFDVKYDLAVFFDEFPFINASEFGKAVGINESLMRKYKSRTAFASAKQKAKIQEKYDKLMAKMSQVRF